MQLLKIEPIGKSYRVTIVSDMGKRESFQIQAETCYEAFKNVFIQEKIGELYSSIIDDLIQEAMLRENEIVDMIKNISVPCIHFFRAGDHRNQYMLILQTRQVSGFPFDLMIYHKGGMQAVRKQLEENARKRNKKAS